MDTSNNLLPGRETLTDILEAEILSPHVIVARARYEGRDVESIVTDFRTRTAKRLRMIRRLQEDGDAPSHIITAADAIHRDAIRYGAVRIARLASLISATVQGVPYTTVAAEIASLTVLCEDQLDVLAAASVTVSEP